MAKLICGYCNETGLMWDKFGITKVPWYCPAGQAIARNVAQQGRLERERLTPAVQQPSCAGGVYMPIDAANPTPKRAPVTVGEVQNAKLAQHAAAIEALNVELGKLRDKLDSMFEQDTPPPKLSLLRAYKLFCGGANYEADKPCAAEIVFRAGWKAALGESEND